MILVNIVYLIIGYNNIDMGFREEGGGGMFNVIDLFKSCKWL